MGRSLAGGRSKAKQECDLLLVVAPSVWPPWGPPDKRSQQRLGELIKAKQMAPSLSLGYLRAM